MRFVLFLLLSTALFAEESPKKRQYQDVIVNNEVVATGWGPDCASRYEAMRPFLDRYQRPITVLDIGANHGYFSLRIAHDYDSTCVMADFQEPLLDICKRNTERDNIIFLKKSLSAKELIRMSECEHFDVVMALNVLHHMPQWEKCLQAILRLGDTIFIETPCSNDIVKGSKPSVAAIEEWLLKQSDGQIIARTTRYRPDDYSFMFVFQRSKQHLLRKSWNSPLLSEKEIKNYYISSDFNTKLMYNCGPDGLEVRQWIKGIHLDTFQALNGLYPTEQQLKKQPLFDSGDPSVLIQGQNLLQGK